MKRILYVEDDVKFKTIVAEWLTIVGYQVDTAEDALTGLELFKENDYDLVISDYDMQSINGLQFIEFIKRINPEIKVIILTGINNDFIEVQGLEMNVDEYIKKPVSFEVLLKRINLVLNKKSSANKNWGTLISKSDNIFVDKSDHKVYKNDQLQRVTSTEYNLLVLFLENKNTTLSREKLLDEIWRGNTHVDTRAIDTHVKNLRAKLNITCIYSIRGIGYEWGE